MEWERVAKRLFKTHKPEHFTNYNHCNECAEHDETLINSNIDEIGLNELGNPGWDPICFCSTEGKKYYMPSFIRLTLETIENEFYFEQFLFHLLNGGKNASLLSSCTTEQRDFIASFIEYIINKYPDVIEHNICTDEALKAHELWSRV